MKTLRIGIWGTLAVLLVLLASIPVVWAMPEQSQVNQSIPTRTSAPALTEPAPTPVLSAPVSQGQEGLIVATPTVTPETVAAPQPGAPSGGPDNALPPGSTSPDAPLPPLSAPGLFPGAAPLPEGNAAGDAGPSSQSAYIPAYGNAPSAGDDRGSASALRWLFPTMTAPQPLTFAALLGIGLLLCGAGLLVFSRRHPTE